MNWKELSWIDCEERASEERLLEVERTLHVRFPDDYRDCAKACHGGRPEKRDFSFVDERGQIGSCLAVLLSFDPDNEENIVETIRMLSGQLPEGVVPFAEDGGGDFMCFHYEDPERPPEVVYWHHERPIERSITRLAVDFGSFLAMLG